MNSHTSILWSDSTVALSWIKGNPNLWKTFVCNRTTEILQSTTSAQWRYCPGTDNLADHLTRGTFPSQLSILESWWHGPKWLKHDPETWPIKVLSTRTQPLVEAESRKTKFQSSYVATTELIIDISHYSSYTKLLRVTAWILRFVYNYNYLRLGGRLQFSNISSYTRHPLLLDGKHYFVHLLIRPTHIRLHHLGVRIILSELRSTFWILRGRQAIKQVIHKCLPCKLSKAKYGKQIEAALPPERVVPSAPFTTTGINFAGPVNIRCLKSRDMAFITLFTCATTRALHIELVTDLTTDKFLLALQRFVGSRGLPHTIYTDNATTFHAANKDLILLSWQVLSSAKTQKYYAQNGITWKFIAPRADWWGGWWECLIGVVKRCLRKVLGRALLDEESLSTALIGIEAALNSRPLLYEDGKDDSSTALTPSHFLTGRKLTAIPSSPNNNTKLRKIYKQQQTYLAFGKNGPRNICFNCCHLIKFVIRTISLTFKLAILYFYKRMFDHVTRGRKLEW
ncbi:uncharacterized protein [Parasteatoda tepidariorum]|uniref:uncharacterized protein n=1 Tax=Parasteatoda tepidariorum TaxID=114398 RepID=UPI0039BD3C6A